MTIPFKFSFIARKDYPSGECIGVFSEDIREILEGEIEPALVISENQDIWVHFQAPDGFFMTMDGLDVISLPYSIDREGQSWLPPMKGKEYISLFQGQDFPLVPGYYVITIEGNDKVWYALIEVTPKFLGKQNWQTMKEELTKEIRHLSFDFMKQHIHIDKNLGNTLGIDSQMLLRFYIINDMFPVVMKSLEELRHTANSRIVWKQRFLSKEKADASIPSRIRYNKEVVNASSRRVLHKEISWDIAENRFAKNLITKLKKTLFIFLEQLHKSIKKAEQTQQKNHYYVMNISTQQTQQGIEELYSYYKRTKQLLEMIRTITESSWFEETKNNPPKEIPMEVFMDPRYAALYRLDKNLLYPEQSVFVSPFYLLQWKRTDKLYELWCFLQFIKALLKQGWVLETASHVVQEQGRYRLHNLEAGTEIILRRKDEFVHLCYDKGIPDSGEYTDRLSNPLYTNNAHRTPDFRMDYYCQKQYYGSLVADFKYRDVYHLWQDKEKSKELRRQFNAYHDMNTRFYRNLDERNSLMHARPVKEVWAIFPREMESLEDTDYSLRFISLLPGSQNNEELAVRIESYIALLKN